MAEIVVADAGPLVALGRLRKLELLPRLFDKVIVPRTVFLETQVRPELADARAILAAERSGVFVVDDSTPNLEELSASGHHLSPELVEAALRKVGE